MLRSAVRRGGATLAYGRLLPLFPASMRSRPSPSSSSLRTLRRPLRLAPTTTTMRLAALPLVLTCLLSHVLETTSAPSALDALGQHIPIYRQRPRTRSTDELLSLLRRRKLSLDAKYGGRLSRRASGMNLCVPFLSLPRFNSPGLRRAD